jgi:uncharacterized protein
VTTHPRWPYQLLDVASVKATGWEPTAFRHFVLKVHQHCNLACDYCYVYELADQSWRSRPVLMSSRVWTAAAARIDEHVRRRNLDEVTVILHGGEPLMAGRERLARLVEHLRGLLPAGCAVHIGMQTNGVLLDEQTLTTLHDLGVTIGVSLDGVGEDHDRHRHYRNGRGSYRATAEALSLLAQPRYRPAFNGLLCTIDPTTDPVATYEALLAHSPPSIDFLLPHANWSTPPPPLPGLGAAPYGVWLAAVFDRWYGAPHKETGVRLFDDLLSLIFGGTSGSEQIGLSPAGVVVVESDGAIEQVDALKSAYPGACETGLNVLTDSFDSALDHPGIVARQIGAAALSETCRECPVHRICGGGHYAHRYRAGDGFRNPSVYTADLRFLCDHVTARVAADLTGIRTRRQL